MVPPGKSASARESFRVLVVDDNPSIRRLIVAALTREGYSLTEAANGQEALDRMRAVRPDLVLLDLMMPIVSGWEVLKARTTDEVLRRIHVIIVSANREQEAAAAIDAGGCAFLPKPFDVNVLTALVRSCAATGL